MFLFTCNYLAKTKKCNLVKVDYLQKSYLI